jgi:hypothetical protein
MFLVLMYLDTIYSYEGQIILNSGSGTVVEHLTYKSKIKDSNPTSHTRREKLAEVIYFEKH